MNKGDVYMVQVELNGRISTRPVIFVDKSHINILTTMNKDYFIPCKIKGEEHYIVPEILSIKGITLIEFIETIEF